MVSLSANGVNEDFPHYDQLHMQNKLKLPKLNEDWLTV